MRSPSIRFAAPIALVALTASLVPSRAPQDAASPPITPSNHAASLPGARSGDPGPEGGAVVAALLPSWNAGGATGWSELAAQWPQFGSIPIVFDTSLASAADFTYEQLAATGADVVILSDPAGGGMQYSQEEVAAVARYAREGHNVVGTFKLFRWMDTVNNALAPIFGLRADLPYTPVQVPISNQFHILVNTPLTVGLGPTGWTSAGYPFTEIVEGAVPWNMAGLAGAVPVAQCDGYKAIVSLFRTPNYAAVFISNMPEYFGNASDMQLLYNAITLPLP